MEKFGLESSNRRQAPPTVTPQFALDWNADSVNADNHPPKPRGLKDSTIVGFHCRGAQRRQSCHVSSFPLLFLERCPCLVARSEFVSLAGSSVALSWVLPVPPFPQLSPIPALPE